MSKPSIAIFGLNGALGATTLTALEQSHQNFHLPILAITRDPSTKISTEIVKYVKGDLQKDTESLIETLSGVDIVISLLGNPTEGFFALEHLLESIKPKVYISSHFGGDDAECEEIFPGLFDIKISHAKKVRSFGIKVVEIATGLFAGGVFLQESAPHLGLDIESQSVTYLGSPDTEASYTMIEDIGKVVASVAIKAFRQGAAFPDFLKVKSGTLTPAEVVRVYEKDNNVTLKKTTIPREEVLEKAKKLWAEEGYKHEKFLYYINALIAHGRNGEKSTLNFIEVDNEIVNPQESEWKWGKF